MQIDSTKFLKNTTHEDLKRIFKLVLYRINDSALLNSEKHYIPDEQIERAVKHLLIAYNTKKPIY